MRERYYNRRGGRRALRGSAGAIAAAAKPVFEVLESRTLFTLLGIDVSNGIPDIQSQGSGSISELGGKFTLSTSAITLIQGTDPQGNPIADTITGTSPDGAGTCGVQIVVDNNGNLVGGAGPGSPTQDLSIIGAVTVSSIQNGQPVNTTYSGTLLTGTIEQFGYEFDNPPPIPGLTALGSFDFRFQATGGLLDSLYFTGQDIGMTLSGTSSTNFDANPFGDANGFTLTAPKADIGPILPLNQPKVPAISTSQQPASAIVGQSVGDQATVTGSNPTGTVTFNLYGNPAGTGTPLFTDPNEPLVNGVATSNGYTTTATGTDYWVATYNGDTNNLPVTSPASSEPVVISPATPAINTTQQPATAPVGAVIADQATVVGYNPTGTVTFNLYNNPNGTGTPLFTDTEALVNGVATSAGYTTSGAGTDYWVATYNGDGNNSPVTGGAAAEPVTVTPTTPQLSTTASPNVTLGTTAVTLTDTAVLAGGYQPTGSLAFTLYLGGTPVYFSAPVAVSGDGTYTSPGYTLPETGAAVSGTYKWVAAYSGDANNVAVTDNGLVDPSEWTTVSATSPTIATVALNTSGTPNVVGMAVLTDSATLANGYFPSGHIDFSVTAPDGTTTALGSATVAGNGTYSSPVVVPANEVGTYTFRAVYSGDGNNAGVQDDGQNEAVTTIKASPAINTTQQPAGATVGTSIADQATVTGGYNPTGTVTFNLYNNPNATGTSLFTDTEPLVNGVATSAAYTATATGTDYWVAIYNGDSNNSPVTGGAALEPVAISTTTPGISTTPVVSTSTGSGGQYATIGFWHNKNGQAVITNFDGSSTSTLLGNSLASNYPNLFGAPNPYTGTSLAGLTNAQLANVYESLWTPSGLQKNTYVQAFAVALGGYSSNGAGAFNVGSNGAAFGVANNTTLPITQILQAANANFSPSTGLFYGGDSTNTGALNTVLNNINQAGEQPGGIPVVSVGTINDTANLSGTYNPGGTITFYLFAPGVTPNAAYSNSVYSDVVTVTGNGPYATATQGTTPGGYVTTATGTYQWVAVYSGDANNAPVTSPFGSEPVTIGQQCPTITSMPNATAVTLGTSVVTLKDTVVLESGSNPTGTLTWNLYLGNTLVDTETTSVNGNGSYATPTGYTLPTSSAVVGTYQWNASYSGDANNAPDSDVNNVAERTVVSPATPTIVTTPNVSAVTLGSSSVLLKDTATLAGGYAPAGTITFTLVGPDGKSVLDTETATVSGNGSYTTPTGYSLPANAAGGTYQWNATYTSGNANDQNAGDINDSNEQVTVPAAATGTISGFVFCDDNLNGLFDASYQDGTASSEMGEAGATISLYQGTKFLASTLSGSDGSYSFAGLALGTYTVRITADSSGHQAEQSHGGITISNSATVMLTSSSPTAAGPAEGKQGTAGTTNSLDFAEISPGGLEGFVWDDTNNDGNIDFNEAGIVNVTVQLNGIAYTGAKVSMTAVTDGTGEYQFTGLLPGTYTVTELTPGGYTDGKDSVGSLGGSECFASNVGSTCGSSYGYNCFVGYTNNCYTQSTCGTSSYCGNCGGNSNYCGGQNNCGWNSGCNNAQNSFCGVQIGGCGDNGINYNFGEHSQSLTCNSNATATIGFWHNKNGQALLCSLNGSPNSKALGNWLATMFPNIYGPQGANLGGMTNTQIAAFYNANDFNVSGMKLNAQVMSAAFACYVTNSTWAGGTMAAKYGFNVGLQGTGYLTVNVGSNGAAFGVSNNSTITILQALDATDDQAVDGLLYNGNSVLRAMANNVYSTINQTGDVG